MLDYITLANRTAAGNLYPISPDLLHCAMGMATEAAEVNGAYSRGNLLEEIGDIMWYVALGCHHLEITLDEAEEGRNSSDFGPTEIAGEFMNQMKRQMFYGKPAERSVLVGWLGEMIAVLKEMVTREEVLFETVLADNITKLQKRYPDKFTEDRAINR